jgi:hypothetical protein
MMPLSEVVRGLIAKARIVSFANWTAQYPPDILEQLQLADDQRIYLTDDILDAIATSDPAAASGTAIAKQLRNHAPAIVDEARTRLLQLFPTITQPGGGLYPAERAEACWRDFWQFLRCITYGIAGHNLEFTSTEGLHYMELLYQELSVPLEAMVVGLDGIKAASLKRLPTEQQSEIAPYFDHLTDQLRQFQRSQ